MSLPISRRAYADMYGPTTGDRVRLGDTGLLIEVERDYCVYGGNGLIDGQLDDAGKQQQTLEKLEA